MVPQLFSLVSPTSETFMEPSHTDPPPQAQRSHPGPQTASSVHTPPPQGSSGPATPPRSPTTPPSTSQGQPLSHAPPSDDRQADSRECTSDWKHPVDGVYQNTPVKAKPSSTSRHGLFQRGEDPHKKKRIALAKEMRWVQCCVADWFERCMPGTEAPPEGTTFAAMDVPEKGAESGMYPGIVRHPYRIVFLAYLIFVPLCSTMGA